MAVTLKGSTAVLVGLSDDQKPTDAAVNTVFQELDTGDSYYFDGTEWVLMEGTEPSGGGITKRIKNALLACFQNVAWSSDNGQKYYEALNDALNRVITQSIMVDYAPDSHLVYTTDSIESLRNFLTVTAFYSDGDSEEVTGYTLEGDISQVGEKTITVVFENVTATFVVEVSENTTGILYEWDFTKSVYDLRQNKKAILGATEYAQYELPEIDSSGVHIAKDGQYIELFDNKYVVNQNLFGKTIELDVSSYSPLVTNAHVRAIIFADPEETYSGGNKYFVDGFIFRNGYGWSFYNGSSWSSSIYSGMTSRTDISGKTVGLYLSQSGAASLYIDGVSKGTASNAVSHTLYGLRIAPEATGFFTSAVISGLRIYSGEVA